MSLIHVWTEDARFLRAALKQYKALLQSEGHPADPSVGEAIARADELIHRLEVALEDGGGGG